MTSFFGANLHAQGKLDSLYAVWKDESQNATNRAEAMADFIYDGPMLYDPDHAFVLADSLMNFSRSSAHLKGVVNAYNIKGYTFFRTGDYPQALASYAKGVALADSINDLKGKADILVRIGYVYHDNEDIISGLRYYQESLKIYQELGDSSGLSIIYNEFGSIYRYRGDFEKSLDYYLRGIEINTAIGEEDANMALFSNIGNLYLNVEDYDKAADYLSRAMQMSKEAKDLLGLAHGLSGLGSIYFEKEEYDKALEHFQQALSYNQEINNQLGISECQLSIADIYKEKKQYQKAISYFNQSLVIAKDLGDIALQQGCYEGLYTSHKRMGATAEALDFYELSLVFKDSLKSEETAIQLQQMEFRSQVVADSLLQVEKDRKISTAHILEVAAKNRNRNYAIAASLFFFVLAGGFYSRWRYVRKSRAIISKEKERSDNLLLNILPAEIAAELMATGKATARDYELVSVIFTDFKSFTEQSASISAVELVEEINSCFKAFDEICERYQIEKIKTIGDAYMAAGGLPVPSDSAVERTVFAALEMQEFAKARFAERQEKGLFSFEMRVGINTGPIVAGIVGVKKFQYDIWGDTVNTASRIEGAGSAGRVNIAESTYLLVKDNASLTFESRGPVDVKGKGEMNMWYVEKASTAFAKT